jgi:hypothetical protein
MLVAGAVGCGAKVETEVSPQAANTKPDNTARSANTFILGIFFNILLYYYF